MIQRYPPNRMLSILMILLVMTAYFSFDLYSREKAQHQRLAQPELQSNTSQPKPIKKQSINKTTLPPANTEVQGARPEDIIIRPGASLVIEKKYLECGHTTTTRIKVPADLVNLTENQLRLAYKDYEIKMFSPNEIIIFKKINSKCENHFLIKEKDGFIAVYYQRPIDGIGLKEVTPLPVKNLPDKEKERLKSGIKVESQQELAQILEDLGS